MIPHNIYDQALLMNKQTLDLNRSITNLKSKYSVFVTSFTKIYDIYFAVCSTGTGWQKEAKVAHWHPEKMIIPDEKGRVITGVMKDDKLWKLQIAIVPKITDQNIHFCNDTDSLTDHIKKQWKRGYDVTDIALDNGRYLVVTSKGLNYIQSWILSKEMPIEKMKAKVKEGSILTDVAKYSDSYLWLFSGNTCYNDMLIKHDPEFDELVDIREKLVTDEKYKGYTLSLVKEYQNLLLLVFHK